MTLNGDDTSFLIGMAVEFYDSIFFFFPFNKVSKELVIFDYSFELEWK